MADINQRQGTYLRMPRELYQMLTQLGFTGGEIQNFFEALTYKAENAIPGIDNPGVDNVAKLDSDGNVVDSLKDVPAGDFVGTTDTQTLTNKTISSPVISNATASRLAYYDGTKVLGTAALQAHIPDGAAVTAITAGAGADTIDLTTFNTDLSTLTTEINALKDKINTLLAALETAKILDSV